MRVEAVLRKMELSSAENEDLVKDFREGNQIKLQIGKGDVTPQDHKSPSFFAKLIRFLSSK